MCKRVFLVATLPRLVQTGLRHLNPAAHACCHSARGGRPPRSAIRNITAEITKDSSPSSGVPLQFCNPA